MQDRKPHRRFLANILNVVTITLIVICFLVSMVLVRRTAREDCFARIEETTTQMSHMFLKVVQEHREKLTVFADILAANNENPDALLQTYMENFCRTQYFSALCIHRADGRTTSYGDHPHDSVNIRSFEEEVAKLPYISEVFAQGEDPSEQTFYQAVPINRGGKTIAVLYGYITLDVLPSFASSTAYDGKCQLYVVDGNTGNFLMDEYHGTLGNIYDGSMGNRETKDGYHADEMQKGVSRGQSGYYIFRSQKTDQWYYTYYMPLGINNWSMQLTIDESTAFATFDRMNTIMLWLMVCVMVLVVFHVMVLMVQSAHNTHQDKTRLHKSRYTSSVQRLLLNAHNNPDHVDQALQIVAEEMTAQTVLLLSFADMRITRVQFWPNEDKGLATALLGKNVRREFPSLFDMLSTRDSIIYHRNGPHPVTDDNTDAILSLNKIDNMVLVPVTDPSGALKGTLVALNLKQKKDAEMLECVTYDFFMAITNLENHTIIKRMGAMDYMTNVKNRNSFEVELAAYARYDCVSLWCVFVDVVGLHEVNNSQGHKAGDIMLCTVAAAVRDVFGEQHTYRHGGDEFVAFAINSSSRTCEERKVHITQTLAAQGYHVSIGYACLRRPASGIFDVEHLVAKAEEIMYQDKAAYYRNNNIPWERGAFSKHGDHKDA